MRLLEGYIPILILAALGAMFAVGTVVASFLIGLKRPSEKKLDPYECGMPPVGDSREKFSVKFFMVAMIFVVFDVEIVFLYPWAVMYRELGLYGLAAMSVFLAILILGLAYDWKMGILDWGTGVRERQPLERKDVA